MRWNVVPLLTGAVVLLPALAASDLVRPPCDAPTPLTAGAVVEMMLGPLVANGVSPLFLAAVAVAGVPWIVAGLGVAILSLPGKLRRR